ncbi:hypothetical protein GCM10020258_52910 [Sphingomonas yabuuchiae]
MILALPVFLMEMGSHLIPSVHMYIAMSIGMQTSWYIQFALTTLVLAIPGFRFYQKGLPALIRLAPDMNSLVAVGTLAAYGYSLVATFAPTLLPPGTVNVYYEAAAVIIALILLGRYLEARAKGARPRRSSVSLASRPKQRAYAVPTVRSKLPSQTSLRATSSKFGPVNGSLSTARLSRRKLRR